MSTSLSCPFPPMSSIFLISFGICLVLAFFALWWLDFVVITRLQNPPKSDFGLIRIPAPVQKGNVPSLLASSSANSRNGESPITAIIWVHGLGSNPDTTWQGRQHLPQAGPPVNWIEDFLFPDMLRSSSCDIEMFHYNYESYWQRDSIQQRLPRMAQDLLYHLSQYLKSKSNVRHPLYSST